MPASDADRFSTTDRTPSNLASSGFGIRTLLLPLASLKLTVLMFAISLVLILAGTMAQTDLEIWQVVRKYFHPWFTFIDYQVFFPPVFFPLDWKPGGGFWFLGGKSIGLIMGINLLSAHALRFRVTGKGKALWGGVALLVAGIAFTWFVIQSGLDDVVESELSPAFCNGLWHALRFALGAGTLLAAWILSLNYTQLTQSDKGWLWWLGAVFCGLMVTLSLWLFIEPEAKLDAAGLRIMWQLIKAEGAALVLLAGCQGVFGRRAGIVLLHSGIALMMFSELWTAQQAQESNMLIPEGQTVNFSTDRRTTEFTIIDKSDPKIDQVTTVPLELLLDGFDAESSETNAVFDDPALPFLIKVIEHSINSDELRYRHPSDTSIATNGLGLIRIADPLPGNTGVGPQQQPNIPALYLEFFARQDKASLGIFLLHPGLSEPENLLIEDKKLQVALRFKKIIKPYSIKLIDFNFDRYVGTNKAKNFSSRVELLDDNQNVNREVTISMNNPLRYHGDTLYQSSYDEENERYTVLQVVTNSGWMIPYISCMIVGTGMFVQFLVTFLRFARKEVAPAQAASGHSLGVLLSNWTSPTVWVPTLLLLFCTGYALSKARVPQPASNRMHVHKFGELPIAYSGRIKPFDSLARNALTVLSDKDTLEIADPKAAKKPKGSKKSKKTIKQPAIFWLLETLAETPASKEHRIIRIENLDVLQALDLKPRKGYRYSIEEINQKTIEQTNRVGEKEEFSVISQQYFLAGSVAKEKRTLPQAKFVAIGHKLLTLREIQYALTPPSFTAEDYAGFDDNKKTAFRIALSKEIAKLKSAPRAIPPHEPSGQWQTTLEADLYTIMSPETAPPNPAAVSFRKIISAYKKGKASEFNSEIATYHKIIQTLSDDIVLYDTALAASHKKDGRKEAEKLRWSRVKFEAFFNHFNPFKIALSIYIFAFLLAAGSWLGWNIILNRSSNWILWFAFALHTFALICRIYISGRPPVTNLYSSAVFIGWAAVLFALVFERIYRFGVGNLLAAAIGFPTLLIAYFLESDGDTFQVLQAVLDTQFWLTTHVVCITLGYSTTFMAGVLGIVYVLISQLGNRLDDNEQKHLIRMIYGTLCFAMFFSFIGTVLGGLWADDSWGRFWGWDPKENGALMIVVWNALVLHARWGGMAKNRGMALLAIFGNVITAWSWFGVNQMGVGKHAYGATEGRDVALLLFVASQLIIMALAFLPVKKITELVKAKNVEES